LFRNGGRDETRQWWAAESFGIYKRVLRTSFVDNVVEIVTGIVFDAIKWSARRCNNAGRWLRYDNYDDVV